METKNKKGFLIGIALVVIGLILIFLGLIMK